MENRIKECQLGLFADRTSCHLWWPNQFRLLLASLAYVLMERLRTIGLAGTEPFHGDGTLPTLDHLMNEVFVGRMAGPRESPERSVSIRTRSSTARGTNGRPNIDRVRTNTTSQPGSSRRVRSRWSWAGP